MSTGHNVSIYPNTTVLYITRLPSDMESDALQEPPVGDTAATAEIDLDWLTLDDDEEILWASTPHKSSLVPALAVGIPLSLVLIGIPIIVAAYLTYTNTNYVVTTRGLYRKQGILSRDVQQIGFDKVQNISYSQGAIGAWLGYGSVDVSTAGGSGVELQFRNIPEPAAVQERISREIERRERGSREDDREDPTAVLDEILDELQGIRRALDGDGASETLTTEPAADSEPADATEASDATDETEK